MRLGLLFSPHVIDEEMEPLWEVKHMPKVTELVRAEAEFEPR